MAAPGGSGGRGVILPGATLGILGGGQLGRMAAQAARSLGYRVHVLDPDAQCAARYVVERCVTASFDDVDGARDLARGCSVVTLEIEKVALASLRAVAEHAPMRPGEAVLAVIQDRGAQKDWLAARGFPITPYAKVASTEEASAAVSKLGGPCFLKARAGGYDGRGQVRVGSEAEAAEGFRSLGNVPAVAERAVDLEAELSVMVARSPRGEIRTFPPALNHHENRILDWSVIPGPLPPVVTREAMAIGEALARDLEVEGLVATEFFLTKGGHVLVNELSPRPHNSFHATEMACVTSQFEQLVRAVCDLPLGSVDVTRSAAIVNLLGDLWVQSGGVPAFDAALAIPGVRLHLYGKGDARPGRKMGHLCAVGATPEEAVARVQDARRRIGAPRATS